MADNLTQPLLIVNTQAQVAGQITPSMSQSSTASYAANQTLNQTLVLRAGQQYAPDIGFTSLVMTTTGPVHLVAALGTNPAVINQIVNQQATIDTAVDSFTVTNNGTTSVTVKMLIAVSPNTATRPVGVVTSINSMIADLNIVPGPGISVASGLQTITVNNTGVLSLNGQTGNVSISASNLPGISRVGVTGQYSDLLGAPAAYVLPVATANVLGGVKVGSGLTAAQDGTLSAIPHVDLVTSVNTLQGIVTIQAVDNGAAGSQSLIANSGATTGNITLNRLAVGGSGLAINTLNGVTTITSSGLQGAVLSVSGQSPASNGNVVVQAVDNTGAGTSLIANSGATTGNLKFNKLVSGSNIALAADSNGNIVINGTVNAYTLPAATSSVLGGVKQGANVSIAVDGTISVTAPYVLPFASASVVGGVQQGAGVTINGSGVISANVLTVAGRTGNVTLAVADITDGASASALAAVGGAALVGTSEGPTVQQSLDTLSAKLTNALVNTSVSSTSLNQQVYAIPGGYPINLIDVYAMGVHLDPSDYTATDGFNVIVSAAIAAKMPVGAKLLVHSIGSFNVANAAQLTTLGAAGGASLIGYGSETVAQALDAAGQRDIASYSALRAYNGTLTHAFVTQQKIGGDFAVDASDTTSADNGGTIIVDALNRRWKRQFNGSLQFSWFGATGSGDLTAAMQACINAAPAGGEIKADPSITYHFTNLTSTKPLTIDFNGASLIVNPSQGSLTTGTPAIWFQGSLATTNYPINTTLVGNLVTTTTATDASNFNPGDIVQVADNLFVPPWNQGYGSSSSQPSTGYSGRSEINRVISVDPSTGNVILENNIKWAYQGGSTAQITKVTNWISKPRVQNIGSLSEVDPGGQWVGADIQQAPHIVKFDFCDSPSVDRIPAQGWQLHVVNFDHCWNPRASLVTVADAFRPQFGGHGYAIRFNRCHGGLATSVISKYARHTVDFCQAYGSISQGNTAFYPALAAFLTHGLGAQDCKSIDDTVYTRSDLIFTGSSGWGVGNSGFSGDYRTTIVRPKSIGGCQPMIIGYHSVDTTVVDPDIRVVKNNSSLSQRAIWVVAGAVRTRIIGGTVDMSQSLLGNSNYAILARNSEIGTDTFVDAPTDLEILGTELIGSPGDGATEGGVVRIVHLNGALNFTPKRVTGNTTFDDGLLCGSTTLASIYAADTAYAGTLMRAISITVAPTTSYYVINNRPEGATFATTYMSLVASPLLVNLLNTSTNILLNNGDVQVNGDSTTNRQFGWMTNGTPSWFMRVSGTRAGSNSGDNMLLLARADSGVALWTPFQITRSTAAITFGDSTSAAAHQFYGGGFNFSGPVTLGTSSSTGYDLIVNGVGGSNIQQRWQTAGVDMWIGRVSGANTGSNAGSDFSLNSRTDAGASLRQDFFISRSNGTIIFGGAATTGYHNMYGAGFGIKTVGSGFRTAEGSNAKQGVATLVAGAVTVANTSVTANSRIFLTGQQDGGTPGAVRVSSRVAGTSFTITSTSGTDTSIVAYEIFEPA